MAQKARKPFFILKHDNKVLVMFKTVLWALVLPVIIANLYFTAFAPTNDGFVFKLLMFVEVLFAVELVTQFFTSFVDQDHEVVYNLQRIGKHKL